MAKVMDATSEIRGQKDRYFDLALSLVLMEASCNAVSRPVDRAKETERGLWPTGSKDPRPRE